MTISSGPSGDSQGPGPCYWAVNSATFLRSRQHISSGDNTARSLLPNNITSLHYSNQHKRARIVHGLDPWRKCIYLEKMYLLRQLDHVERKNE